MARGGGGRARSAAELLDEFADLIDELASEARLGVPIIVEGRRDVEALRRLGIRGEVIPVRSIKGLRRIFEERCVERVILLPDLDEEGERVLKLVKQSLEGVVREVDISYWRRLNMFKRLGYVQIETMEHLAQRIGLRHPPTQPLWTRGRA